MYMICHSLGGLVLCQMLVLILSGDYPELEQRYQSLLISEHRECFLKGIVFLGTPFKGSMKANTVSPFINALKVINPVAMNANVVRELRHIRDGTGDLADISRAANIIFNKWNIDILVGCETAPIPGTGRHLVSPVDFLYLCPMLILARSPSVNLHKDCSVTQSIQLQSTRITKTWQDSLHGTLTTSNWSLALSP